MAKRHPALHPVHPSNDLAKSTDRERYRLKLDMWSSFGEAAHYTHILKYYPECRALIKPLHQAVCQRGSEVKGVLDAVIKLRQSLSEAEDA